MAFNINTFRNNVIGLARGTLFEVVIANMPQVDGTTTVSNQFKFTCKAASLPASTIGVIDQKYFGRSIYYAGDRSYDEWTTTIIGMNDWALYTRLLKWHEAINHPEKNIATSANMLTYKVDADVKVYDQTDGTPHLKLKLIGLWPTKIGEVALSWEDVDKGVDISTSWRFDYVKPLDTTTSYIVN